MTDSVSDRINRASREIKAANRERGWSGYTATSNDLGPMPSPERDRKSWLYWSGWFSFLSNLPIDQLKTLPEKYDEDDEAIFEAGWLDGKAHYYE